MAGTKLPSAQKEKGAAPLYKVKTAVAAFCRLLNRRPRENVTMFTDISKFCTPHSVAWVLSCATHTQHARNMACCAATQRCNLRCFALLPLTGCKKGRTSFKRLAVPKMRGKSAKHRKLQRCVARNTPCCVHVAYVLRMTKPTQRCEGCKKLKCLRTLSHFPLVDA